MLSELWVKEIDRSRKELRRFRLMMIRLEDLHPKEFALVQSIFRGVDNHALGLYDGDKVNDSSNEQPKTS